MFLRQATSKYTTVVCVDTKLTATESAESYIPLPVTTQMVLSKNGNVMCKDTTGQSATPNNVPRATEKRRISVFKTLSSHSDPLRSRNSISETKRFQNLKQVTIFENENAYHKYSNITSKTIKMTFRALTCSSPLYCYFCSLKFLRHWYKFYSKTTKYNVRVFSEQKTDY